MALAISEMRDTRRPSGPASQDLWGRARALLGKGAAAVVAQGALRVDIAVQRYRFDAQFVA
ncbi:hypothetical protein AQZ49_07260 [Novosphingobium sp. FSW06-99]|nr:hypothetical protein AQZ49_07260 [Novosphingobium sp. FSW06-99]